MRSVSQAMQHSVCVLGALLGALTGASAHALDLSIEVTGARSTKGFVTGAIYAEAGWLKTPLRGERVEVGDKVVLVFRNLVPGTYALALFHDENGNGKLDSNALGLPTEHYGFSRDAQGVMGPPKFADAALQLDTDTVVKVTLK
jgi:uncharacterized protein (DUF2141 family)